MSLQEALTVIAKHITSLYAQRHSGRDIVDAELVIQAACSGFVNLHLVDEENGGMYWQQWQFTTVEQLHDILTNPPITRMKE